MGIRVYTVFFSIAVGTALTLGFGFFGCCESRWALARNYDGRPNWRLIGWVEQVDGNCVTFDCSFGSVDDTPESAEASTAWRNASIEGRRRHFVQYFLAIRGWPCRWLRVYRGDLPDEYLLPVQLARQIRIGPGVFVDGIDPIGLLVSVTCFSILSMVVLLAIRWTKHSIQVNWRREHGCCEVCGYNLRGCEGARCPECGWADKAPSKSAGRNW